MELLTQNDKKWRYEKMGKTDLSIGGFGCAITSLCNIANMNGKDFTPFDLNIYLTDKNGYQNGANVVWAVAGKVLGLKIEPYWWLAGHGEPELDFNDTKTKYIVRYAIGNKFHFTNLLGSTKSSYIVFDVYDGKLCFINKSKVDRIVKVGI